MNFLGAIIVTLLLLLSENYSFAASNLKTQLNHIAVQNKCYQVKQKFKHYEYEEAFRSDLVSIGNNQLLQKDAAMAFLSMKEAASKDGIYLQPISGFRSVNEQRYLFYEIAKQRKQTLEQRAKVSAPPGHSQHHTGFAIDLNSLNQSFAHTKAFAWLQKNAKKYEFYLSFPHNNPQGIAFEPWHWAWHGSEKAQQALHVECSSGFHFTKLSH